MAGFAATSTRTASFHRQRGAARLPCPSFAAALVLLLLAAAGVEALLALRLWFQLSGVGPTGSLLANLYDLSSTLVGPFRSVETTSQARETGILEFATLVAIEAYLVLAGAGMLLLFLARSAVRPPARR